MKKLLFAAIAALALTTTALATDGGKNVNYWVLNKFKAGYPDAKNVDWTVTEKFAKAVFIVDDEKLEAYYSPEGEFIAESKTISVSKLTRAVRKVLDRKYKDYTVKEITEYSTPDKLEYYITIESDKSSKILKASSGGSIEVFRSIDK